MRVLQQLMRRFLLFFFSHRTLALIRWDIHFTTLRLKNFLTFAGARARNQLAKNGTEYLNLGSGPRGVADGSWLNIDGYPDRNVHFQFDLTRRLPFPNDSFAGIFSEHVLEHFDLEQGRELLRECLRVLRPGGVLRLVVPDGETILKTYCDRPGELVARRATADSFPIDAVNSFFRQRYEHQYIYDWPMMQRVLTDLGFSDVRRVSHKKAAASHALVLDDEKYAWESLYVEAAKPV